MISYQYSYLIGSLAFLLVWIVLFLWKKRIRKEMLMMSILVAPLGPISEFFYFKDYWNPDILVNIFGFGIEDMIFAFAIGGIAAVIYEEIFIRKQKKTRPEKNKTIVFSVISALILLIILNLILKINSIYASSLIFLFFGLIIIYKRRDLIKNAIVSGLLVLSLMFVFYILFIKFLFSDFFIKYWQFNNISGITFFGIPIGELLWGFSWGFLAGPFYEFWKGLKEKNG